MRRLALALLTVSMACAFAGEGLPSYKKLTITEKFYCEGAYYADFNKDGKPDAVNDGHAKEYDGALKILSQAAKETSDKDLKALIYNAKGVCLYEKNDFKAARWEFLWVDVVYNHAKNEHAKALYYLSKIFNELGEPERAQECREQLLNDRAFTGSEWRARAQKEAKAS